MQYKRSDKIAAFIHEEVGKMILTELKDPAVGFITITKVRVSDDNRHAKIYYSVLGDDKKKESAEALSNGTIDAYFWSGGIPTGSIVELATTLKRKGKTISFVTIPKNSKVIKYFDNKSIVQSHHLYS